jgi:hypothetical protein
LQRDHGVLGAFWRRIATGVESGIGKGVFTEGRKVNKGGGDFKTKQFSELGVLEGGGLAILPSVGMWERVGFEGLGHWNFEIFSRRLAGAQTGGDKRKMYRLISVALLIRVSARRLDLLLRRGGRAASRPTGLWRSGQSRSQ